MQADRMKTEAKLGEELFYASLTTNLQRKPTPDQMIGAMEELEEEPE